MWLENKLSRQESVLLERIKSKAKSWLNNSRHKHFTDHTIAHSERIINILGRILKRQFNLNKDELFILFAATYLHDLGMQIRKSDLLTYPNLEELLKQSNLAVPDLESGSNRLLSFVREYHHLFSYYMIKDLLRDELGLDKCQYTEEIALVAQGHRKVDLFSDQYQRRGAIRIDLLSALLILADELDCDKSRVDLERMMVLDLSMDEKMYWYNHTCIDRVEIDHHYIKLLGRAPTDLVDRFKLIFVMPIWKKYREVLDIFYREDIVIAWAPSEIIESNDITRIFQKEKGLIEHIQNKCRDLYHLFAIEKFLGPCDNLASFEDILDIDVSPFYSTGIEMFSGIKLRKWPENAYFCEFFIYDDPEKLRGDSIPKPLWKSEKVEIGQAISVWPELDKAKEYAYVILFYQRKEDDSIYVKRKGRFWLIDDSNLSIKKRVFMEIDDGDLSLEGKRIVKGDLEVRIGNYENALLLLRPLLEADVAWHIDVVTRVMSIYKMIEKDMNEMEWYDEADRINDRMSCLVSNL